MAGLQICYNSYCNLPSIDKNKLTREVPTKSSCIFASTLTLAVSCISISVPALAFALVLAIANLKELLQ